MYYLCTYSFSCGKKISKSIRLSYQIEASLKASVLTARSENGLTHVWNLKTHRVDTALDGHGRKSVYCVETMGGKNRLLRLAKQSRQNLVKILVSVLYVIERGGGGNGGKKGVFYLWSQ